MRNINLFLAAFLLSMAYLGSLSAQSQEDTQKLSVRISTKSISFKAGAEIDVNVDLTNPSASDIQIARGVNAPELAGFEFLVTRSGTMPAPAVQMTPYYWAVTGRRASRDNVKDPDTSFELSGSFGGGILLKAGGATAHFSALLNDLYDLSQPGRYTIQTRKWPYGISSGVSFPDPQPVVIPIESNSITITVTEPPPPAITLELSTTATSFASGSDIDVAVTAKNIATNPISMPLDSSQPKAELNGVRFSVAQKLDHGSGPDSSARAKFAYPWVPYEFQYLKLTTLQPNQTIQYTTAIASLHDMATPGTYTLKAEMVDPVTHLAITSNAITIAVQ